MTAVATAPAAPDLTGPAAPARPYRRRGAVVRRAGARLRYLPLPDTEPPVEHGDLREQPGTCVGQGVLALLTEQDDEDEFLFGPQPTPSRELPDPTRWGRQVTQLIVEVQAGQRPAAQLVRWTSEHVYRQIREHGRTLSTGRDRTRTGRGLVERPVVGGVRVSEPDDGVAEVAAVVHRRHRVQAVALRMEGRDGRWVVTVLECG
jgi:transposase InsO family protein